MERLIKIASGFVAAVTDESGTILWTCGERGMRRRAGAVNFAPGGRWGEEAMGTNALSLALRNDTASTVFSAEHLVHALHGWVCYCTPLHGPDGSVLGVLDLSSTWDRSHPLAMPALRTLAGAVEARLAERRRQEAGTLSGGEQQMLAFARALMSRPRLICMDEPTMGLSPKLVDQVLDEIVRINEELAVAVLFVEQQAELALSIASRGYVLATGEIVLQGSARELLDNPEIQEAYLGKGSPS